MHVFTLNHSRKNTLLRGRTHTAGGKHLRWTTILKSRRGLLKRPTQKLSKNNQKLSKTRALSASSLTALENVRPPPSLRPAVWVRPRRRVFFAPFKFPETASLPSAFLRFCAQITHRIRLNHFTENAPIVPVLAKVKQRGQWWVRCQKNKNGFYSKCAYSLSLH